jgi:hypothetical protein
MFIMDRCPEPLLGGRCAYIELEPVVGSGVDIGMM